MALLECQGLGVRYGELEALAEAALAVDPGTTVAVIGPNGAGKTSLLRGICGLEPCFSGSVRFDGAEIANRPPAEIVRLGVSLVPDGRQLFPNLPVRKNLWLGAYLRTARRGERRAALADLERVYDMFPVLRERAGQSAGSLSGGEQQMVAIGRALMGKPRLLILDEPSLGLAPVVLADIFAALARLVAESEVTIVLVEQNVELALRLADEVYVLEAGRVAVSGPVEQFRDADIAKVYLGA